MRDAVAWCARQPRTWAALAAATTATALASGDGRAGWTAAVGLATFGLAALSMRGHFLDEHPDRPTRADRARARHEAMVEASLRRYQGKHAQVPPPAPAERRHERDILPAPREPGLFAWGARRVRTWVALAAATVVTAFAPVGGVPRTAAVAVAAFALAALAVYLDYAREHPDRPTREERRAAKYEAWAETTLGAYRAKTQEERRRSTLPR